MSHFSVIRTQLIDIEALIKALKDLGFKEVEVHEEAQHLYGYKGDRRPQTAEVIIRRKFIGRASNDIGFKRGRDNTFDAIISDYDKGKYNENWRGTLTQRYAYHLALAKLQEQGFEVVNEEKQRDGRLHLMLRRMG